MTALMMGMMEPPPEVEGEFHDWCVRAIWLKRRA
jgi:hypothetical protein